MKAKAVKNLQQPTAAQIAEGLIISVGEARKVLGAEARGLSDEQVAAQILIMADLATELLQYKHFAK